MIGTHGRGPEQLDVHQIEPQVSRPADLLSDPFEGAQQSPPLARAQELVRADRVEPLSCLHLDRDQYTLIRRGTQPIHLGPARAHIAPQAGPALRNQSLMIELLGRLADSASRVG